MFSPLVAASLLLAGNAVAHDTLFAFSGYNPNIEVETRTLDEIHQAAVAAGETVVTCWHGGDEKGSRASLKSDFEKRFPGMTLNVTVDLSKYHDANFDRLLATDNVYVDSIILQTTHDYPRWRDQGALLNYAPLGFDKIYSPFRDVDATHYGVYILGWQIGWHDTKLNGTGPVEYSDFLDPIYKDKIVLTYPNDDDAVLFSFDLILRQYGLEWFEGLLKQNPRWVRGTATPGTLIRSANTTYALTFTSSTGLFPAAPMKVSVPEKSDFITWAQTAAIPKAAPNKEAAKLFHSYILSEEYQIARNAWSVRTDVPAPQGYPDVLHQNATNSVAFKEWMADRVRVERLKLFFESKIGTPQGLSPLEDDL